MAINRNSRQVVFDIETSSLPFDTLTESQQEYLLREANKEKDETLREEKRTEAIKWLSLYPFTAEVVVIGMFDIQHQTGYGYYRNEGVLEKEDLGSEEFGHQMYLQGMPEKEMLEKFWEVVQRTDQIISFNGRGFDLPFLMLRSAKLGVCPSKNFMGNRFSKDGHIDLLEQLSFYGAYKRFNLDFYCHGFGIESPKSKGISGYDVPVLYQEGRVRDIAVYCLGDITATYRLFETWNEYLNI